MNISDYKAALDVLSKSGGALSKEQLALVISVIEDAISDAGAAARAKAVRSTYAEVMGAISALKGSAEAPKVAMALADTAVTAKLALAQLDGGSK